LEGRRFPSSAGQFDQLLAWLGCVLNDAMHVGISCIVPDSFALEIHAERVSAFFEMCICMLAFVSSTPDFATDETLPETRFNMTYFAFQGAVIVSVLAWAFVF
ncbi:hypothetical protein KCU88_g372, partial [Aureobasidium melanogenum]